MEKKYIQAIKDESGIHLKVEADKVSAVALMVVMALHISKQANVSVRELTNIIAATAEKVQGGLHENQSCRV